MTYNSFYDPDTIGQLTTPDTSSAIRAGRQSTVKLAEGDTRRTALLLIDMQVDFIHEDGALPVPGAIDDTRRLVEWLYENTGAITQIYASLDSHLPLQIFSPGWWANEAGEHPQPYTVITHADVTSGQWHPLYDVDWSVQYTRLLEETAKKQLMIWPYHTLVGTPGHMLIPALYESIAYHSSARGTQPRFIQKGSIANTENYSMFEPEVKMDTLPGGGLNRALLDELATFDRVFIAGQAKSHCVLESVTSMMRYYGDHKPSIIPNIHLLTDAMSSVAHPDIDFEAITAEQFEQYAEQGLQLVTTASIS